MDRLDSWKSIAAYLKRDIKTVRRWERQGLPVHRVPGKPRQSVFAYPAEIDAWMVSSAGQGSRTGGAPWRFAGRRAVPLAAVAVLLAAAIIWGALVSDPPDAVRVDVTASAFIGRDANQEERWQHRFPAEERAVAFGTASFHGVASPGHPIFAGVSAFVRKGDQTARGGEVLRLNPQGTVEHTHAFDDAPVFRAGTYRGPWFVTDLQTHHGNGQTRVAVVAHHHMWWPSLVAVLDDTLERQGVFVHAGWIEEVRWVSPTSLLAFGYSQEHEGGVAAILDTSSMVGQGPVDADGEFHCETCGTARPVRYVVMPRTEVNQAAAARFNRAKPQLLGAGVIVQTVEVEQGQYSAAADAIYEFTTSLEPLGASFSTRYWEVHRELEAQGRIDHSRDTCPDRHGPRAIKVWEPQTGWRTTVIPEL